MSETIERAHRRAAAISARRFKGWTRLKPAGPFLERRFPYPAIEAARMAAKPPAT